MGARNPPEDFAILARTMTISEASRFWKCDSRLIKAWAQKCGDGLPDAMAQNALMLGRINGRRGAKIGRSLSRIDSKGSFREPDDSRAMRHLQRVKRWVCYSTRIHGDKEVMYHVGNRKLTFDELIELAKKTGFQV